MNFLAQSKFLPTLKLLITIGGNGDNFRPLLLEAGIEPKLGPLAARQQRACVEGASLRVLVLINPDQSLRNISVFDEVEGRRWTVPLGGDSIVTAGWKPKKALKE
uniref:Uncharacterized protein n=1 Tax=Globodera rostochiensis TaxID=31243 RepID=A0A914H9G0_GLORO